MKKKILIIVSAMIIGECIAVALIFVFLYLTNPESISKIPVLNVINSFSSEPEVKQPGITASIRVSDGKIFVSENIVLKKPSDSILLYTPSVNQADINIKKVSPDGGYLNLSRQEAGILVQCKKSTDVLHLEYEILPTSNADFISYTGNRILLTNFLVTPAVNKGGQPVQTYKWYYGDPYIYDINNYTIDITVDKNFKIYAPGKKKEEVKDGLRKASFFSGSLRDFPVAIFKDADIKEDKFGDITVYYIDSFAAKDYVRYALQYAERNIGPYPYKELFIVKTPLAQRGMEFSNMIFLSDSCFSSIEDLKRVSYHEVLHQWFYCIIGTDQFNEPFFDEGLVEYLSLLMCNTNTNESFSRDFRDKSLGEYTSKDEYYAKAYRDSASYFRYMHSKMGESFFTLLKNTYKNKRFSIAYFDEFLSYAKQLGFNEPF